MCDDHGIEDADPRPNHHSDGFGRRDFVRGAVLGGAGVAALGGSQLFRPPAASAAVARAAATVTPAGVPAGRRAVSNAMHVHASSSEMQGSWDGQAAEAVATGTEVLWPTDHDWRMQGIDYINALHFVQSESFNTVSGRVTYVPKTLGSLASSSSTLSSAVHSPNDPAGNTAVIGLKSAGAAEAHSGFNIQPSNNLRTSIQNTALVFDLLINQFGADGWAEVLITLSYHPAQSGRLAGQHQIAYRFGTASGKSVSGLMGIVNVPVSSGWNLNTTINPVADFATLWPDMAPLAVDNNVYDLFFWAGSRNGAAVNVGFANVSINRAGTSGNEPLRVQNVMLDEVAARWGVEIRRGLEVSLGSRHNNWFAPRSAMQMPDYSVLGRGDIRQASMDLVHSYGGRGSINHLFGVNGALTSQAAQNTKRRSIAKTLLAAHLFGADIIEVGYQMRGGVSLDTQIRLANTLWRNGLTPAFNGVNDNHLGVKDSWIKSSVNTFRTIIFAPSNTEQDLLDAIGLGMLSSAETGILAPVLWFDADGMAMGSTSTSTVAQRTLNISASSIPSNGFVDVIQGPIDHAGVSNPEPGSTVVASVPAAALAAGEVHLAVSNSVDSYVHLQFRDTTLKRVTAFTTPLALTRV